MQKARGALVEHNITTREQLRGVADHELVDWFVDGRSHAQGDFVPIDFDAVAKARTGRNKVTLQVLWGRYTAQPADPGQRYYSYERFRQLVAQHVDATGVTARIVHAPAHTMQVDWAGTKMRLFDPTGGRPSRLSVFVASLPYSGMLFLLVSGCSLGIVVVVPGNSGNTSGDGLGKGCVLGGKRVSRMAL